MKKQWYHWLPILVTLFGINPANAAIFSPTPGDESVGILGMIFGPNIGHIILGGQANPALMHMFEIFNIVAVSIGTIIVMYIGVVSLINTAQEGKTMGKKWTGIWIPSRSSLGMMLLLPTPGSGYSIIQVAVMWVVMQGIGAADTLWNSVLDNFLINQGPTTGIHLRLSNEALNENDDEMQLLDKQANNLTKNLLNSAACAVSFKHITHDAMRKGRASVSPGILNSAYKLRIFDIPSQHEVVTPDSVTVSGEVFIGVRGEPELYSICGRYEIVATVSKNEWPASMHNNLTTEAMKAKAQEIYEKKILATHLIYTTLLQAADGLADNQPVPYGYKNLAQKAYTGNLSSLTRPIEVSNNLATLVREKKESGWTSAGPFYASLQKVNQSTLFRTTTHDEIKAKNIPQCSDINCATLEGNNPSLNQLNNIMGYSEERLLLKQALFRAAQFFINDNFIYKHDMSNNKIFEEQFMNDFDNLIAANAGAGAEDKNVAKEIFDLIIDREQINNMIKVLKDGTTDPLLILTTFGAKILSATENHLIESIKDPKKFAAKMKQVIAGSATDIVQEEQSMFLSTITIVFFIALWSCGALLALYIPFIPFMIYTIAAIGWLILVVEAIVAAPLLAISFILPSGDELGKVVQGLMILLNIFLRPILILFGFVLASRLFRAVFTFIHYGLSEYMQSNTIAYSLLGSITVLIMYIVFIVSLTNKCFTLIYVLPDKILRWVGGGPEQTDASQEMQMTKGSIQRTGDISQKLVSGAAKEELYRRSKYMAEQNPEVKAPRDGA